HGSGHGLAVALATIGQICVRLGNLVRAEEALHRALDVRSPIQFHETTGAVFDTLAQIHLIRGRYDTAAEYLERASEAYGAYGRQTSRWYEWSVRVLGARLALRRGAVDEAARLADAIVEAGAPPFDALQAALIAADADDAIVRRIVDAAALPDLLGRETAAALFEVATADCVVVYVERAGGDVRVVAAAGWGDEVAIEVVAAARRGTVYRPGGALLVEPLGHDRDGARFALVAAPRPIGHPVMRRLRMIATVARQGFALCAARDRSVAPAEPSIERSLE